MKKSLITFLTALSLIFVMSCSNGSSSSSEADDSGTGTENESGTGTGTTTPTTPPASNVTIIFDENNGQENAQKVTKSLAITASLPTADELHFAHPNAYTFVGWGTTSTAAETEIVGSDYAAQLFNQGKTSATLYAVWGSSSSGSLSLPETYHLGTIVLADGTFLEPESEELSAWISNGEDASNPAVGVLAYSKHNNSVDKWYDLEYRTDLIEASSKSELYMVSVYCAQQLTYAKEGAEGASKEISSCLPNGAASGNILRQNVTSFTGEVDGSKNHAALTGAVTDYATAGNYPYDEWASKYGTEEGWAICNVDTTSYSNNNIIVIPSTSKYAGGWYVPSIAELCVMYANDAYSRNSGSAIVDALKTIQEARGGRGCNGRTADRNFSTYNDYEKCFRSAVSSSDASATTRWHFVAG